MSGSKASASCPGRERKKARTSLATTTEQPAELDKETPSLSYVQDENHRDVYVNLKVKGQDDCLVHYRIKKTQALKKLLENYCNRKGLQMNSTCFLFFKNGELFQKYAESRTENSLAQFCVANRLGETQTPDELKMEDDDVIDARTIARTILAPDALTAALAAVPAQDWSRTWAADRTIMLRMTSKTVKEAVDKVRPPAVVRLRRSFRDDARNGTAAEKLEFVFRHITALTAWCCITTLELRRCAMEKQDAERLAGVLAQCPALAHLDLSSNENFGPSGAEWLAGVLGQCASLAHLNLSGNSIDDAGAESFAGVLGQCAALAHLNLSRNRIKAPGAESFAGVLGQCASLAHLDLSRNGIGSDGAESLAGVLGQCAALAHLNLGNNGIGPDGAESFAGVLGQCASLALLNLSGNSIGDAGAECLAEVLGQYASLAHLNLSRNRIKAPGAESLAVVLGQCASLAHLNLRGNAIQDDGAESLAGVLGQCASLAHLNLSNNEIGPDGAESFAGVLGQCAALAHLNLRNNEIGDAGAECLAGVLGQCASLTHLDLGGNRIGAEGTGRLRETWQGPVSGLCFSLTLTVKGEDSSLLRCTINKATLLKKLMETYCLHKGLEENRMCFLFDGNRLSETQTPAELNMEDGDVIDARKETFKKQDS